MPNRTRFVRQVGRSLLPRLIWLTHSWLSQIGIPPGPARLQSAAAFRLRIVW